jgi:hypothetical protein
MALVPIAWVQKALRPRPVPADGNNVLPGRSVMKYAKNYDETCTQPAFPHPACRVEKKERTRIFSQSMWDSLVKPTSICQWTDVWQ